MIALDKFPWCQLGLGDSAGTHSAKIMLVIDALRTAEFLVAVLLPLRDQVRVCPFLSDAVLVKVLTDFLNHWRLPSSCNRAHRCTGSFGDEV